VIPIQRPRGLRRGPRALVHWIADSNPAQGMDVCPRLSTLCCPVWVEALRRADYSSKESYRKSMIHNFRSNCELEQTTRPNP
jgi:hypothetical protein